jgi:hypothetical protein
MNDERLPSCYRRLWLFSDEARELGTWVFNTDLDCIIADSLDPLFEYDNNFVGYRPRLQWGSHKRVAGGTWMHRTGTMPEVWTDFSAFAASEVIRMGYKGSDQAWLSHRIADPGLWQGMGIFQRQDMDSEFSRLPDGARILHFNGFDKPWTLLDRDWIREHWQ